MDLTDDQWTVLEPVLAPTRRADGRGRPWQDARGVLNGVLWVLRTGAPWTICQTAIRRIRPVIDGFSSGSGRGCSSMCCSSWRRISATAGSSISPKASSTRASRPRKKGLQDRPTKRWKGCKIMAICDGHGLPLAVHLASASPGEVTLVEATLDDRFLADFPDRLIGDKAYDSDPLDTVLMTKWGIELIARHRSNRRRPATQDGRPLAVASGGGRSSDSSRDSTTTAGSWCAGNGRRRTTWRSFMSPAR